MSGEIQVIHNTSDPGERAMLEQELIDADIQFQVHEQTNVLTAVTVAQFLVRAQDAARATQVIQSFSVRDFSSGHEGLDSDLSQMPLDVERSDREKFDLLQRQRSKRIGALQTDVAVELARKVLWKVVLVVSLVAGLWLLGRRIWF